MYSRSRAGEAHDVLWSYQVDPSDDLLCAICGLPRQAAEGARYCLVCPGTEWTSPERELLVDPLAGDPGVRVRHSYATPA